MLEMKRNITKGLASLTTLCFVELERSNVLQIRKLRCNPRLDRVDVAALGNFISIEKGSADHKMLEKAQGKHVVKLLG